jgi:hypothetical protein
MAKEVLDVFPCNLLSHKQKLYFNGEDFPCYGCNGVGGQVLFVRFRKNSLTFQHCPVCGGSGRIDFILNILRNKKVEIPTHECKLSKKPFKCSSCGNKSKNCKRLIRWARKNFRGQWIW